MATPKCLVCQENIPEKRRRHNLQGTSQEAALYADSLGAYLQTRGLSSTVEDLVAGAEGQAYMCSKCGQTLRDADKLKPQLDKVDACLMAHDTCSSEPVPQISTPTRRRPVLPTDEAPTPKRSRKAAVGARSSRTPVLLVPYPRTTRRYYVRSPSRRKLMVSLARGRHPGKAIWRTGSWLNIVRLVGKAVVKEIRQMNR